MKVVAIVVALAVSVVGVALFARAVASIVGVVKLGKPAPGRGDHPGQRWRHMLAETLGHTRMLQWTKVGAAHWFVFIAFGALIFTLITAYGQLFDPRFALPIIGHWVPYEWASEIIAWAGLISISFLIMVRLLLRGRGRESRFFGSRSWQGYYVELTVLGIVVCVLALHAMEYRLLGSETSRLHFPLTWFLLPPGLPRGARNGNRDRRRDQDHHLDGLVHRDRTQHHDGRRLAPIHRLAEHLVQARVVGTPSPRRTATDHDRRQAARLRRDRGPR